MTEFARVAIASRVFSLAAIIGLAIAFSNQSAVGVAIAVITVAAVASYVSYVSAVPSHWVIAAEASVVSLVVVPTLPDSVLLLPYLVTLPLLTGLARGMPGASLVIVCQIASVLIASLVDGGLADLGSRRVELLSPWALTIVGSGLIGAWAKKLGKSPAGTSMDETYDSARRLLGQLRTLARRLSSGLDPVTIATQMLAMVDDRAKFDQSAVFIKTESGLFAPLAYSGAGATDALDAESELLAKCWKHGAAVSIPVAQAGPRTIHEVVLPLRLGKEMLGVLLGRCVEEPPQSTLESLQPDLDELSLPLATALAFDEVRSLVTADERQRLAREIHDGIAQEVASLGYAVDEIAAVSTEPDVTKALGGLRAELSRVVTELRLSIFDLRAEVGDGAGLGSALSDYVRKVGARSSMTVHLTLDEAPTRLNRGVETELFRIAQEAITNARKHSVADNLWVDCWVKPPSARIRIMDDGRGMSAGRSDSYGLRIMRERAERIEANLRVEKASKAAERPGTCVTVSLGDGEAGAAGGRRTST